MSLADMTLEQNPNTALVSTRIFPNNFSNRERTGDRSCPELDKFTYAIRERFPYHGILRAQVMYQTCGVCGRHETVFYADPLCEDTFGAMCAGYQVADTLPFLSHVESLRTSGGELIPLAFVRSDTPGSFHSVSSAGWALKTSWQVVDILLNIHLDHCAKYGCDFPYPYLFPEAKDILDGNHPISTIVRVIPGVRHTDADMIITRSDGFPFLLVEESRNPNKAVTFTRELARMVGGSVVRIITDKTAQMLRDGKLVTEVGTDIRIVDKNTHNTDPVLGGYPQLMGYLDDLVSSMETI